MSTNTTETDVPTMSEQEFNQAHLWGSLARIANRN